MQVGGQVSELFSMGKTNTQRNSVLCHDPFPILVSGDLLKTGWLICLIVENGKCLFGLSVCVFDTWTTTINSITNITTMPSGLGRQKKEAFHKFHSVFEFVHFSTTSNLAKVFFFILFFHPFTAEQKREQSSLNTLKPEWS